MSISGTGKINLQRRQLAQAWTELGHAHFEAGKYTEADKIYRKAAALDPMYSPALNAVGATALRMEDYPNALAWLERTIAIDPLQAAAWSNLAATHYSLHQYGRARAASQRALALEPGNLEALMNLASVYGGEARIAEACDVYEQIVRLHPDNCPALTNLIFQRDLLDTDPAESLRLRRFWYERFGAPLKSLITPHENRRDPHKRLRVGYLTSDIRLHSAVFVFGSVVRGHSSDIECYVYSTVEHAKADGATEQFKSSERIAVWRECFALSDLQIARQIRRDRIDILVDLNGHSAGSRLRVFAMQPAPVQVTAWGYAHGTGIPQIRYMFGDPIAVTPEHRQFITEEIWDLPCIVPYAPPSPCPEPAPAPSQTLGVFTYGSMNRIDKITDRCWDAWAEILHGTSNTRLLVKTGGLTRGPVMQRAYSQLERRGIGRERLVMAGESSQIDHLGTYAHIDLALDSFPHCGGVTSLEALWMGCPVLTLTGTRPGDRTTTSVLHQLGLPECAVSTIGDYIASAIRAAQQSHELARLRVTLRPRLTSSILRSPAYVDAVEAAYRAMWTRWCEESDAQSQYNHSGTSRERHPSLPVRVLG